MDKKKIRLGIVGLGKMGLLHASLLNVLPETEIVALCDKSKMMNRLFKKAFSSKGVQIVDDTSKLMGLGLDAVYITTPISSHSPIIRELYSKEVTRNIFVEKTLASNYEQAKELCELAKSAGGLNMVGYMKRFSVVFGKAKELLEKGDLGTPESFSAYAYSSDFTGQTKESKSSAHRGGALRDIGCHVIDLALWLLNDLEVAGILSLDRNEAGSETAISFTVNNGRGLTGQFDISQKMANYRMPEFGLSIKCQRGSIEVNDDRLRLTSADGSQQKLYRHDLNNSVFFSIGESEYFREDQHFINSLLNNTKCEPSFVTASKVDQLIDQVRNRSLT